MDKGNSITVVSDEGVAIVTAAADAQYHRAMALERPTFSNRVDASLYERGEPGRVGNWRGDP